MNPLISRLYPSLRMNKDMQNNVLRQAMNKEPKKVVEEPKPEPKKAVEQPEPKKVLEQPKVNIDDELDAYITQLEDKYTFNSINDKSVSELEKKPKPKQRRDPPPKRKQTTEEQKERMLNALSRKKVNKAEEHLLSVKNVFDEAKGDEKELKKKESELRKGIKLIRQSRILKETGDLVYDENKSNKKEEPHEETNDFG